jgi:Leucine-rich repeat (LRR) protein
MMHRLRVLDLQRNWLVQLPAEIALLTGLERLDVSQNVMTSLPAELGTLKCMVHVFRQEFTLEEAIGSHVCSLESSKRVTVQCHSSRASTLLTGSHCKLRPNTEGLRALDCRDNMLNELPPTIGNLKQLGALLLDGNRLETLPAEVGELWSLRVLRLSRNRLTSITAAKLHAIPSLYMLTLDQNPLLAKKAAASTVGAGAKMMLANAQKVTTGANSTTESNAKTVNVYFAAVATTKNSVVAQLPIAKQLIPVGLEECQVGDRNLTETESKNEDLPVLPVGVPEMMAGLKRLTVGAELVPHLRNRCGRLQLLTVDIPSQLDKDGLGGAGRAATTVIAANGAGIANTTDGDAGEDMGEMVDVSPFVASLSTIGPLSGLSLVAPNGMRAVPAAIFQLKHLTTLRLANMQLKVLPRNINQLTSLRLLAVENNTLKALPYEIGSMHCLHTLRVYGARSLQHGFCLEPETSGMQTRSCTVHCLHTLRVYSVKPACVRSSSMPLGCSLFSGHCHHESCSNTEGTGTS